MYCKKIVTWGRSGSGKTTLAVNLALAISEQNYITGLLSSNLMYGGIQTFFGQTVPKKRGLINAINNKNGSIYDFFEKSGLNDNLFLLATPNRYTGLDADGVSIDMVDGIYNGCDSHFDYLIIDGSEDITNPISSVGLTLADSILTVYRPSVITCLWQTAMERFMEQLRLGDRMTRILNADQEDCASFKSGIGVSFDYELPYVHLAQAAENEGKERRCCVHHHL